MCMTEAEAFPPFILDSNLEVGQQQAKGQISTGAHWQPPC